MKKPIFVHTIKRCFLFASLDVVYKVSNSMSVDCRKYFAVIIVHFLCKMFYRDEEKEVQQMQMQSDTPPPVQRMKLQPDYQTVQQIPPRYLLNNNEIPPSPIEQQRIIVPSKGIVTLILNYVLLQLEGHLTRMAEVLWNKSHQTSGHVSVLKFRKVKGVLDDLASTSQTCSVLRNYICLLLVRSLL